MDLIRFGLMKAGQIFGKRKIMFSFFINCHVKTSFGRAVILSSQIR